ncbi:MAG: hypothetical protein GX221_02275 [Candidatus Riflebacteria bacterium]|nr:hypothetical protein [Candidatus Riflebacteria bacterium]
MFQRNKNCFLILLLAVAIFLSPFGLFADEKKDDEAKNPLSPDIKVSTEDLAKAKDDYILDIAVAEAAQVVSDGFPLKGTLQALGGSSLRLRAWPWGEVLGLYPEGTAIEVRGVSGEFYLVDINGTQGYMHRNYVSIPDRAASGVAPDYPGDTKNGGALPIEEGVKISQEDSKKPPKQPPASPSNPAPVVSNGSQKKISVPLICQGDVKCPVPWSACGPTSMAMLLAHKKGVGTNEAFAMASTLWNQCGTTGNAGTNHQGMVNGAKAQGFSGRFHYSCSLDWIKKQIDAGKPVIANVTNHYLVVIGYDDKGFIINDPAKRGEQHRTYSNFDGYWNGGGCYHSAFVLD